MSMNAVERIRMELRVVSKGRSVEVQTFAGWTPIDRWTPYGIGKDGSKADLISVEFYFDADKSAVRERPNAEGSRLNSLVPGNVVAFGVWPIRFVDGAL
jgi:hypothetical protein